MIERAAAALSLIGLSKEFGGLRAVDGVSLTVASVDERGFEVAIIPHTRQATIVRHYRAGSEVNLEVDLLARYLEKLVKEES